jgi:membrane protein required for colicin V production
MMLGTFLNYLMSKLLTITGLKFADRLLGGVFGVARGVIIVLVILFISGLFLSETEQWQQSTLIPYGLWMTEWLRMFVGDTNSVYLTQ